MELAADNERLVQEKITMKNDLEEISESININKVQDYNMMEIYNYRFMLENKMKDLEINNKKILNEKQKYEIEFKILQEKYNDLKKNSDIIDNEYNYFKQKQNEVNFIYLTYLI
jgi:hypothetical protein